MIADAPRRKQRRRRAVRIVFPDPDRGRKPKRIPALHLKTWEEYMARMLTRFDRSVWKMQAAFRRKRLFKASERRSRRRAAAALSYFNLI